MKISGPRSGAAVLLTLLLPFLGNTRAHASGTFGGETIIHVGDGGHEAWRLGAQDVGYKYSSVSFLCLDLWSWGGTYCVYQRFEHKYRPISQAQAARLLGKKESELQTPFWYRYPPGLFIFGPLFIFGAIAWVREQQVKQAAKEAAKLVQGPSCPEAWKIAGGRGTNPASGQEVGPPAVASDENRIRATFEAGVQQPGSAGMDRRAAEQNLESEVTCPGCGHRHPRGTPACGCGNTLP